jgi:hypothetical protein
VNGIVPGICDTAAGIVVPISGDIDDPVSRCEGRLIQSIYRKIDRGTSAVRPRHRLQACLPVRRHAGADPAGDLGGAVRSRRRSDRRDERRGCAGQVRRADRPIFPASATGAPSRAARRSPMLVCVGPLPASGGSQQGGTGARGRPSRRTTRNEPVACLKWAPSLQLVGVLTAQVGAVRTASRSPGVSKTGAAGTVPIALGSRLN